MEINQAKYSGSSLQGVLPLIAQRITVQLIIYFLSVPPFCCRVKNHPSFENTGQSLVLLPTVKIPTKI